MDSFESMDLLAHIQERENVCLRIVICIFDAIELLNGHHLGVKMKQAQNS